MKTFAIIVLTILCVALFLSWISRKFEQDEANFEAALDDDRETHRHFGLRRKTLEDIAREVGP